MIVSGSAGTGKSFLIHCLKALLLEHFTLPTHGEFKALEGEQLQQLQQRFSGVDYLIIDEMSMLGRKLLGQVDQRLCQAFPHDDGEALGQRLCLLVGDFGQLPSVMDLPLYSSVPRSAIADLGHTTYQLLKKAVVLTEVWRQDGQDREQVRFRELLDHLRNGEVSVADWELLMAHCSQVDSAAFDMLFTCTPQYKLLMTTMLPSFVTLESLLQPSKLFMPVPMPAKHLQKMLQDLNESSVLSMVPELCSPLTYGQMLAL